MDQSIKYDEVNDKDYAPVAENGSITFLARVTEIDGAPYYDYTDIIAIDAFAPTAPLEGIHDFKEQAAHYRVKSASEREGKHVSV